MKTIKADIKEGSYKKVYLLYGTEPFLKNLYRDKLKEGVLDGADEMNFSRFEGRGIDETELVNIAQTLPFFAERRLILVENSGWFKSQSGLADELDGLPDSTVLVFVEEEVDKRNRLYKAVKDKGYVCEMNGLEERELGMWTATLLKADEKKITDATMTYFLEKVGSDMENIRTEVEKLIGYTWGRDVITVEDIDAVCTEQISGKIFQMIDEVASRNPKKALALYHDLLVLREKPMSILFLMLRQFNILLQVKQLGGEGMPSSAIAKSVGVPPFAVGKYAAQARAFDVNRLHEAVRYGVETEEQVKTGQLQEQLAVELMIVRFAM